MKKILHILLIISFSFTIISCAQINTLKDDLGSKYDEFSSESDETAEADTSEEPAAIAAGTRPLFVSVGSSGITQTNNNVFVKMDSGLGSSFFGKRLDQTTFYPDVMGGEMVTAKGGNGKPGGGSDIIDVMATSITDPIVLELNKLAL